MNDAPLVLGIETSCDETGIARIRVAYLQPAEDPRDIVHVIKGVIEAEAGAISYYSDLIQATDGVDPVTQDMVITILADEEGHMRLFEGYLKEYEAEGLA